MRGRPAAAPAGTRRTRPGDAGASLRHHEWGTQPEFFGPRHEHRLAMFTRETAALAPGSRVLDAAVGLGQLAMKMQTQGHRVVGVDSSIEAATFARTQEIVVVVGDLSLLPFKSGKFDAITSGETLEHLERDGAAVEEMNRVVKNGGRCIITVPALEVLWSRSDDYYEHRRRYSRRQLTELFKRAAFEVKKARFWGFPTILIYDTLVLLPMNRRRSRRDVKDDPALQRIARAGRARWLVRVVKAVFSIDKLFGFVPFGPGLILVAEKKPRSS